jgi:phosphoribosylformylglycinamidine cyclo-ligase
MTKPTTYKDAGVNIDAANVATKRIRELAKQTFNQRTLSDIGSFGGMFDGAFPNLTAPVLVASADGVGTKLKIAFMTGIHNTVGRDLVNHCVNDILVQGAQPLFFLDYIATGKLSPDTITSIVEGITDGCRDNGCVLLGGETAEMPGFYPEGEYDVAGFIVGVVDRHNVIDGKGIVPGDVLLCLPSVGLHTNGYSFARKLLLETAGFSVDTQLDEVGLTVGQVLLLPHVSYLAPLRDLLSTKKIKGLAHITGGGLIDNLPRILPAGTSVEIAKGSWPGLPIFALLEKIGSVPEREMYRSFNMGVGMVVISAETDAQAIKSHFAMRNEKCYEIGRVVSGDRQVKIV